MQRPASTPSDAEKIIAPFADHQATVTAGGALNRSRLWIGIAAGLLVLLALAAAVPLVQYYNGPYRAMEEFPVGKYFDDYRSLAGSRYRADVHVEADLGWKDSAGRLMLFSIGEDPRPFAIMIPVSVASGITFAKGQSYTASVQVKEGGLIYADSFHKN